MDLRAAIVVLAAALLTACGASAEDSRTERFEDDMPTTGVIDSGDPWLMWGTSEELFADANTLAVNNGLVSHQLSNVDYHHPTTWTIFLAANATWAPVEALMGIETRAIITFGVGRSLIELPPVIFDWSLAELQPDGVGELKYTTQIDGPELVAGSGIANPITKLPAQSIQIRAEMISLAPTGANSTIRSQVWAFCAPQVHVRPDWFLGEVGNEAKGR